MDTEHFTLAFAIIAQAQADDKNYKKLSINSQWNTSNEKLIIYFKNKIVIPVEILTRLIDWYANLMPH